MTPAEIRECLRAELTHAVCLSSTSVGHAVDRALVFDLFEKGVIALHVHEGTGDKNSKALAAARVKLEQMREHLG